MVLLCEDLNREINILDMYEKLQERQRLQKKLDMSLQDKEVYVNASWKNSETSMNRQLNLINGYAYHHTFTFTKTTMEKTIDYDYTTLYIYSADCLDIPLSCYGTNLTTNTQVLSSDSQTSA